MHHSNRLPAYATVLSTLALISGCGGGGGNSPPPPAPPPANRAPTFTTAALSTNEDINASAQLTATDPDGNALTFALVTNPQHGTATLSAAGALTFTPAANYSGPDSLTVSVTDSAGAQVTGTVNVTVNPINDPPVVQNDRLPVAVTPGQPIVLAALANDQDIDGDTLIPAIVTQPIGGTVVVNPTTRQMTFQQTNGYVGPIEFTYRVNDGSVDSSVATVRAVIGEFENLLFVSDYTTTGVAEVHLFDGFEIRRLNDALPAGSAVTFFHVSGDLRTLLYVVDATDAERVYVKPVDGSSAAALRYTSGAKSQANENRLYAYLNVDGSYMTVNDGWFATAKHLFVVNTATGAATRVAGAMPGVIDTRFALFHPSEPRLIMVQGQTAGAIPSDETVARTAFIGDAADTRTLTQIGRNYNSGEYGAGEGFYYGTDPRYIYHNEFRRIGNHFVFNILVYDRQTQFESALVRNAAPPDRGLSAVGAISPDLSRMCFAFYLPSTTTIDGPSRFYSTNLATPGSQTAVSPVVSDVSQCTFASDNRTVIYRIYTAGRITQQAYAVDSASPGTPRLLAPPGEAGAEQGGWYAASTSMRIAIPFFDNDGNPSLAGQIGRFYSLPLGSGDAYMFSDNYVSSAIIPFFASNADGSFIAYPRPQGAIHALELMSTHRLNYSISLSRPGQTLGPRYDSVQWMRRYP